MIGSLGAAEGTNGEEVAEGRGLLRRFFLAAAGLAALGACSPAAPEAPQLATALPAAAPLPATAPAAPARVPASLTGLSAGEVVALFGEPDFRRTEPPAELWQYRSADCVLDVFLYSGAGGQHVVYSDARERSLVRAGTGRCAGGGEALAARTRQASSLPQ